MINGSHVVVYSQDAEADRALFRDVFRMPSVDAGGGWLIFALPPSELAFHPAAENGHHQFYFMCDNLAVTREELERRGVQTDSPQEEIW